MAIQLLFKILLVLASLEALSLASAAAVAQHPVAKTNCMDRCGNVSLPFPFGVGRGCFFDEWYEIVCLKNDSGVPQPQLKKLDLKVLSISLPLMKSSYLERRRSIWSDDDFASQGTITISFPIAYSNYSSSCRHNNVNETPREPLTFYQSPLVFSETENIFLAFGCDVMARLRIANDTSSLVGCMITHCTSTTTGRYSACAGLGCCISTILPSSLQGYSVEFDNGTDRIHDDCGFASFVQKTWFKPYATDLYAVRDQGYVPVVLTWGIVDATWIKALGDELDSPDQTSDTPFECKTTSYINQNSTPFMQCCCYDGYGGNPYLQNGCQDINECADTRLQRAGQQCPPETCYNYNGSYYCNSYEYSYSWVHIQLILIYVGIGIAPFILCVLFICFSYKWVKKRNQIKLKKKLFKECVNKGIILQQQFSRDGNIQHGKLFTSKKLRKATDKYNENRVLGQGGQGTVYKGTLKNGSIVAVKKSKEMDDVNVKQFINEVVILSQISHRNIVKLLGVCLETDVPLLVYEFIPNGTLYHYLHHPNDKFCMTWDVRLRIAVEVADALAYMHSSASIPIYHRDIKSTNILLDETYRAKVADFGTSRTVSLDQTHVTTLVQGTFGYLDPEYFRSSQFTDKSDVYSFRVVLVELLTGQKPISLQREGEDIGLAAYFFNAIQDNHLFDIIDKEVVEQAAKEEIETVANLTRRCLHVNGRNRPTMREVAAKLESIRGLPCDDDQQEDGGRQESFGEDYMAFEVSSEGNSTSDAQPLRHFQIW